jgi:hypothetical protein
LADSLTVILVAMIAGVLGPGVLAYITGRQRRSEKLDDYARQDKVAAEAAAAAQNLQISQAALAQQAADASTLAATQAAEAARLLVVSNAAQATAAKETSEKLTVIHGLVNSSLTEAISSELASTRRELVLLKRARRTAESRKAIEVAETRIAELTLTISDRNKEAASVAHLAAAAGLSSADGPAT